MFGEIAGAEVAPADDRDPDRGEALDRPSAAAPAVAARRHPDRDAWVAIDPVGVPCAMLTRTFESPALVESIPDRSDPAARVSREYFAGRLWPTRSITTPRGRCLRRSASAGCARTPRPTRASASASWTIVADVRPGRKLRVSERTFLSAGARSCACSPRREPEQEAGHPDTAAVNARIRDWARSSAIGVRPDDIYTTSIGHQCVTAAARSAQRRG